MTLFDRDALYPYLAAMGLPAWSEAIRQYCSKRLSPDAHGTMPRWIDAWHALPDDPSARILGDEAAVRVHGDRQHDHDALRDTLMQFHPWRKGPFDIFGLALDTEWRSELKWARLAEIVQWEGKRVLDVGCGNGYYGWRMLDAGASLVLGCEPYLLYLMQFEAIRRYAETPERHFVVPLADDEIPTQRAAFDIALSMGVLYHRSSPIDHLRTLHRTLRPGGQFVLETLVIDRESADVLVPESRYAKMRNVWFIPSVAMLTRWLRRTGFRDIECVSVVATTDREQRRTEWMTFESLPDFLDPADPTRTCEGYAAPRRAIMRARRA